MAHTGKNKCASKAWTTLDHCAEAILSKVKRQSPRPQHLTEFIKTEILKAGDKQLYVLVSIRLRVRIKKGLFKQYKKYMSKTTSRHQWRELESEFFAPRRRPTPTPGRNGRSWAKYKK